MSDAADRRAVGGLTAFRHRDFAAYWFGSLFGNLGFQMQSAALFWQVYDLTGSTLDLAFIGLAEFARRCCCWRSPARSPTGSSAG